MTVDLQCEACGRLLALVDGGCAIDWLCFVEAGDLERAIELDHDLLTRLAAMPWPLLIDTYGVITSRVQSGVNNDNAELWLLTATGTPIRQIPPSSLWQSEARRDPASS